MSEVCLPILALNRPKRNILRWQKCATKDFWWFTKRTPRLYLQLSRPDFNAPRLCTRMTAMDRRTVYYAADKNTSVYMECVSDATFQIVVSIEPPSSCPTPSYIYSFY